MHHRIWWSIFRSCVLNLKKKTWLILCPKLSAFAIIEGQQMMLIRLCSFVTVHDSVRIFMRDAFAGYTSKRYWGLGRTRCGFVERPHHSNQGVDSGQLWNRRVCQMDHITHIHNFITIWSLGRFIGTGGIREFPWFPHRSRRKVVNPIEVPPLYKTVSPGIGIFIIKMVARPAYLYYGNPFTCKTTSLYWDSFL